MPKCKVPLYKKLIQLGEVLFLIGGDTSCHSQVLHSDVYSLLTMQHWRSSCFLIVNGDRHLVRELEDRLVQGRGEGEFWIIKSLDIHEMILSDQ